MARSNNNPPSPPKVTDLLIRQKCEAMIEYGYVCLRQFPTFERHVLAAEIRNRMWTLLHLIVLAHKRYHKRTTRRPPPALKPAHAHHRGPATTQPSR